MRLIGYKITYLKVLEKDDNVFTPNSNQCTKMLEQNSTLQKFYQRGFIRMVRRSDFIHRLKSYNNILNK